MSSQVLKVGSSDALSPQTQSQGPACGVCCLSGLSLSQPSGPRSAGLGPFPLCRARPETLPPSWAGVLFVKPPRALVKPAPTGGPHGVCRHLCRAPGGLAWRRQGSAPRLSGDKRVPWSSQFTVTTGLCLGPVDAGSGGGSAPTPGMALAPHKARPVLTAPGTGARRLLPPNPVLRLHH